MANQLVCVFMLGLAFMLVFTAFQTMGNIQKTILDSIAKEDPTFSGDGYTSLAIVYAVFALCNWAVPPIISLTGPRFAMIYGGFTYALFIAQYFTPRTWLLYAMSGVLGSGAAMIWTGQGNYLALNSNDETATRNSGIFWALLQLSMFLGNTFVYVKFKGMTTIDHDARNLVMIVLCSVAAVGIVVLFLLPKPRLRSSTTIALLGPIETLKGAGRLFVTKHMMLLSVTFAYTGLELGFFSGVYSSCIGFTKHFSAPKELVGLSGILIGIGEVVGGCAFGVLGSKMTRYGRDPIIIGGFVLHAIGYFLIFLNLPNNSPFGDTTESAFISSSAPLAIFCSFLLGLGDACYNTQLYAVLCSVYADSSASAFAIFKFIQSVSAAACFFYASHIPLYGQLGILMVSAVVGTIAYVLVEISIRRAAAKRAELSVSSSEDD